MEAWLQHLIHLGHCLLQTGKIMHIYDSACLFNDHVFFSYSSSMTSTTDTVYSCSINNSNSCSNTTSPNKVCWFEIPDNNTISWYSHGIACVTYPVVGGMLILLLSICCIGIYIVSKRKRRGRSSDHINHVYSLFSSVSAKSSIITDFSAHVFLFTAKYAMNSDVRAG